MIYTVRRLIKAERINKMNKQKFIKMMVDLYFDDIVINQDDAKFDVLAETLFWQVMGVGLYTPDGDHLMQEVTDLINQDER